jgi:hypothetical protein
MAANHIAAGWAPPLLRLHLQKPFYAVFFDEVEVFDWARVIAASVSGVKGF